MENKTLCALCQRPLSDNSSKHHLVPRTFGGREIVLLHKICHRQIHAIFTERELQHYYNTIDRILKNETMRKFVRWVRKKPVDFHVKTRETNRLKGRG